MVAACAMLPKRGPLFATFAEFAVKAFNRKGRKEARKVRKGEAFSTQTPVHWESITVNDE